MEPDEVRAAERPDPADLTVVSNAMAVSRHGERVKASHLCALAKSLRDDQLDEPFWCSPRSVSTGSGNVK
jgi:hypothetical protein